MAPSRSSSKPSGKHEWNSFENYRDLLERYLATPLIESHDVEIIAYEIDGETFVAITGSIRCRNGIVLDVEKYADTELRGTSNPRLWVRTYSYRYNAYIPGKCTVLRYDNGHDFEEYHAHPFDPSTGEAIKVGKRITREEMPHLSQVLAEIDSLPIPN